MRTVVAVTLGLVGILVFEGCGSDSPSATSGNNFNGKDASAGGFYSGSTGGTPTYGSGGDTSGATGGDTSGSTGGDTTGSTGGTGGDQPSGSGGATATCDPGFCPSAGTGTPCCLQNTCGLDFGMGCVVLVPDGGP
jgi:hypothetical protein